MTTPRSQQVFDQYADQYDAWYDTPKGYAIPAIGAMLGNRRRSHAPPNPRAPVAVVAA